MSRVLPPELQTRKVRSLTGDAKKLVEDLLAEKFDIKEEVVKKKSSPSFPEMVEFDPRFVNGFNPNVGNRQLGGIIRVEVQPWNGDRIAKVEVNYPDSHSLKRALIELDNHLGHGRARKIYMGRRFLHEMMRDFDFERSTRFYDRRMNFPEGTEEVIGEIFGFPIVAIPSQRYDNACIVEQRF